MYKAAIELFGAGERMTKAKPLALQLAADGFALFGCVIRVGSLTAPSFIYRGKGWAEHRRAISPEVARRLWFAFETTFPDRALLLGEETLNIWSARLMSGEQFYINYSLNGEHYSMGPYHTRRFAGVSNVYLGNKPPDDKSYRKRVPITKAMEPR
jgi:hypothetical protein